MLFNNYSRKSVTYDVPANLAIDLPGKYGTEEIGKAFVFGGIIDENHTFDAGMDVVLGSMFKLFGFRPHHYVVADSTSPTQMAEFVRNGNIFELLSKDSLTTLQSSTRTNMTLQDFYAYHKFLSSIPAERNFSKSIDQGYLDSPEVIEQDLLDITIESPLNAEKLSIAVLNGTDLPGIASLSSRAVKNIGGRVVAVSNTTEPLTDSVIVTDKPDSVTVKLLQEVFGITSVVSKSGFSLLNQAELDRSDVLVILGFDIASEM